MMMMMMMMMMINLSVTLTYFRIYRTISIYIYIYRKTKQPHPNLSTTGPAVSNGVCCVSLVAWPFVFIFRMSVIRFEIVGTSTTTKWEPRTYQYIPVTGIFENIQHGETNPILYSHQSEPHDDFYGKCDLVSSHHCYNYETVPSMKCVFRSI